MSDVFTVVNQPGDRMTNLLALYRRQLKARFSGRFDLCGRKNQLNYSLVFGTNHVCGFVKMKEAMWSVDKQSGMSFSDARPGGEALFIYAGFEPLWDMLRQRFAGKTVPVTELYRYVNAETDYLDKHARAILKEREKSGDITAEAIPGQKRIGKSFTEGKVRVVFPT